VNATLTDEAARPASEAQFTYALAVDTYMRYYRGVSVESLEQRLFSGDDVVLREIYEEFAPMVLGVCRKLVGVDAEDVAQQVFVDAWRARERFDPNKGSLGAWLSGISRFKAIDHLRAKGRRHSIPSEKVGEQAWDEVSI